jgi:hypothetical protein
MPAKMNIPDACVPGPGNYEIQKEFAFDKRKFTFGPRTLFNDPAHIALKKGVPGPGFYPNKLAIDKYGKYIVSNYL